MKCFKRLPLLLLLLSVACAAPLHPVSDEKAAAAPAWPDVLGPLNSGALPEENWKPAPPASAPCWFWPASEAAAVTAHIRIEKKADALLRHLPGDRIEHLPAAGTPDVLIAVEDLTHHALCRYDPPVKLFPKSDAPLKQQGRLTIYNRHDPAQKRDEGTWEETSRWIGTQSLNIEGRSALCRVLQRESRIKLKLAQVTTRNTEWYSPDGRLIAWTEEDNIRSLLTKSRSERKILIRDF